MVTKNREKWAGKVRIIGVSSDQDKETMAKHCRKEGWMDVEHYHKHESNCSEVYSITGIPHVIIIDTHGKIAFK
jgi:hypothetical protein